MKRRTFIKQCGCSAIALSGASLLTACQTAEVRHTIATINTDNELSVNKKEFGSKQFVLLENPQGEHPIVVFKVSEDDYSASLMSCTHQRCGTEVVGDVIVCPCHGSRFSNQGKLIKGPAERDLDSYKIRTSVDTVFIKLS